MPVIIALGLSVLLHAGIAAVLLSSPAIDAERNSTTDAQPDDRVNPGINRSNAVSISWIGFEDPTPHAAPEYEIDQAQVSPDAGPAVRRAVASASESFEQATESVAETLERFAVFADAVRDRAEIASRKHEAALAKERAQQARRAREQAQENGGEPNETALPDEREATATSKDKPLVYKAGQPLARQGLSITTVRPNFDSSTRLMELRSAQSRALVAISFARDGRVRHAGFIGGGTGFRSVDETVLTAVYRWRAQGTDLDALPEGDEDAVVTVRIRFDL